MTHVLGLQM